MAAHKTANSVNDVLAVCFWFPSSSIKLFVYEMKLGICADMFSTES